MRLPVSIFTVKHTSLALDGSTFGRLVVVKIPLENVLLRIDQQPLALLDMGTDLPLANVDVATGCLIHVPQLVGFVKGSIDVLPFVAQGLQLLLRQNVFENQPRVEYW